MIPAFFTARSSFYRRIRVILHISAVVSHCTIVLSYNSLLHVLTYLLQLCILCIYSKDCMNSSASRGDVLNIFIDNKNGAPIYDQIYNQIKSSIINGELKENDPLPSIRNLAKDLRISVITTKRAYDELEREGFIYTLPAKGCFVAPKNTELLREENLKRIEELLTEVRLRAASCSLSTDDIIDMYKYLSEN